MYGLINKITAQPGKRDDLIRILIDGTKAMPGCLSYVVARDLSDKNAILITEVWADKNSHTASLDLETVRAAIGAGRPLMADMMPIAESEPVGGVGI